MATAVVEERQLLKTLRWWDGFVIALCNPGFLLGSLGFTLGIFGAAGSMILWGASAIIGMAQAWIYSEPATMFGHRSGGISLYAHEGWRRYSTLVGPLSAFGYWIGWSVVLSIFGKIVGDLATAQWWPNSTWTVTIFSNHLGLPHFIAIGTIVAVWTFNIFGLRPAVWFSYVCAALLMIPLALFIVAPYITGDWHSSNVHATFTGPRDGIKQLGVLNRHHVPGRAMTVDMVVNILLVVFITSNLAILYMSNIGYVLCHVFALSGFLLLRRDRPNWPRPIKIANGWLPIVAILCALNAVFLLIGALAPKLNGYGTWTDFWIGIGVLLASLALFFFRRIVHD